MSWTEQLEAHAARMREKAGRVLGEPQRAEVLQALRLIPGPEILKVVAGKISKPIKSARRLQALLDNEHRRSRTRARKARRDNQTVVEVPVVPGGGRRLPAALYPECLFCKGESMRAGTVKGEQRYRCKTCRRTYYADAIIRPVDAAIALTCCRCGSANCAFRGTGQREGSGIVGHCKECRKNFTQGGRYHLDHTLALLVARVRALPANDEIKADVYAEAAVGVLQGLGYTWNIELNTADAWSRGYKAFKDEGDGHPVLSGKPRDRD